MADTPGGAIGSAPVGWQPLGASTQYPAVGSAAGSSTASGAGNANIPATASASGSATVSGAGASLVGAVGLAVGTSDAVGVSPQPSNSNADWLTRARRRGAR